MSYSTKESLSWLGNYVNGEAISPIRPNIAGVKYFCGKKLTYEQERTLKIRKIGKKKVIT